jgi:hypothetical protein
MAEKLSEKAQGVFVSLKKLRTEFKEVDQRYHEGIYNILQEAAVIWCGLKGKANRLSKVLAKIKAEDQEDGVGAIVKFITNAKTGLQTQRAWKFSRALTFLLEHEGIPAESIAKVLRERGGVEKVAREAAKYDPRTQSPRSRAQPLRINLSAGVAKKIQKMQPGSAIKLKARRAEDGCDELLRDIVLAREDEDATETW